MYARTKRNVDKHVYKWEEHICNNDMNERTQSGLYLLNMSKKEENKQISLKKEV